MKIVSENEFSGKTYFIQLVPVLGDAALGVDPATRVPARVAALVVDAVRVLERERGSLVDFFFQNLGYRGNYSHRPAGILF